MDTNGEVCMDQNFFEISEFRLQISHVRKYNLDIMYFVQNSSMHFSLLEIIRDSTIASSRDLIRDLKIIDPRYSNNI